MNRGPIGPRNAPRKSSFRDLFLNALHGQFHQTPPVFALDSCGVSKENAACTDHSEYETDIKKQYYNVLGQVISWRLTQGLVYLQRMAEQLLSVREECCRRDELEVLQYATAFSLVSMPRFRRHFYFNLISFLSSFPTQKVRPQTPINHICV